jgi:hypothetical protein
MGGNPGVETRETIADTPAQTADMPEEPVE